jgi:hypothetical protein
VHEEIGGGGEGKGEVAWEIFILSSSPGSLAVWNGGETETDDNPCDRQTRHPTANGESRPGPLSPRDRLFFSIYKFFWLIVNLLPLVT